ncbi:MAG: acyl carrier protein [Betaproteobacteria bacterium]|nr:acyl carrier protein [Betaproteobacteria bacterium]MBK9607637.1 acyl carrier protein [Betaproteobacteria bacterium]
MSSVEEVVREFIVVNFLFGDTQRKLSNDDSLLEHGIIDSTGIMELVFFLEDKYSIEIEANELVPANLDSINKTVDFIKRKAAVVK